MQALFDLIPLAVFFVGFKFYGIFVATAASMVASGVQVVVFYLRHRRFETAQIVTLVGLVLFGTLTLVMHDATFIKWKLSVVDWVFAALILASALVSEKTAIERLLGAQVSLPARLWQRLNTAWGLFFLGMGALNVYIAFFYGAGLTPATRERIWVDFRVFGSTALTLIFALAQGVVIARHVARDEATRPPRNEP